MKKLFLAFLWHMHQPCYRDEANRFLLPYVFLHAIKDYHDMAWYVARHDIKCTFNLVPSLLVQLDDLSGSILKDTLVYVISKEITSLTKRERVFLEHSLFGVSKERFIQSSERYLELHKKYEELHDLEDDELLDAEVLFLLAHCGYYLRQENDVVRGLFDKSKGFTQKEKEHLLYELQNFIKGILPLYKRLLHQERIAITSSPFYHPILPLLIDMKDAVRAHEGIDVPQTDPGLGKDATEQVRRALYLHHKLLDNSVKGFWPSEGAVSEETLDLLNGYGLKYLVTDEDILFKTTGESNRAELYKIYDYNGLKVFFRDKNLSNDISFRYASMDVKEAVDDFIGHLRAIYENNSFNSVVSVAMDGENAWEFYKNNGFDFFDELYGRLKSEEWIECVTFDELLEADDVEKRELNRIEPGSWVFANFDVWVGKKEKNRAWELLSEASRQCNRNSDKTLEELLIAEGSDWFWWYDNDFYTPIKDRFDALYRKHLINAYRYSGKRPPVELFKPIARIDESAYLFDQRMPVMPIVDGRLTSAFEWMESVIYQPKPGEPFKFMRSLVDDRFTYIALFGSINAPVKNAVLSFDFPSQRIFNVEIPLSNVRGEWFMVAVDEFVEIRISRPIRFDYAVVRLFIKGNVKHEQFFDRV